MSVLTLLLPLGVTIGTAVAATAVHHRLPPHLAARVGVAALAAVVLAAVPTLLVVATAYLAHVPVVGTGFEWCARAMGVHGAVPAWLGLPALAAVVSGVGRSARVIARYRSLRHHGDAAIQIAPSDEPFAVTLPGRGGRIVISTAMLSLLDEREREVVIAHEQAHAQLRHDRYLVVAALGAAVLPPLRSLGRRVDHAVERWADEVAATVCGDRRRVALTLGKVALHSVPPTTAGFSGLGVASRMAALLEPPVRPLRQAALWGLWAGGIVAAGGALTQLHQLEGLLGALCPH